MGNVAPLTPEEINQYKQLPALNLVQIAKMLQKTPAQVHEMSRKRAMRPLPVFKSGREIFSTWARIQQWIDEGFEWRGIPAVQKKRRH
jgi:hypothetical protein